MWWYNLQMSEFSLAYTKLNMAQKKAVDAIDGPVMVVAGPGTGKTQVLALRIANILQKTDTQANSILCLTFTRSGVLAMRERLAGYIGVRSREVTIATFHSFAIDLIEKHYELLDFESMPSLLTEQESVALIDELLHQRVWNYIRPRGDSAKYFNDLKSLVSLLKRERLSIDKFLQDIENEIEVLNTSEDSISSRGATKGQLKKEVQKKIEGLTRTREVVAFFESYETLKRERRLMDYDDVLEYAVQIVEENEDARADIRENYLYILVDEHQDSSGVQNSFLKAVWQDTEKPNIFVVGDDRQLIYGFGGASLSYFEEFKTFFGKAKLITLIENYRSTAPILSLANDLLKSTLTTETLRSNRKGNQKVGLYEYSYPRDEIVGVGNYFKKLIDGGESPEECALLVPRNRDIRSAVTILRGMGIPVRSVGSVSLFSLSETDMFKRVLGIIVDPFDNKLLASSLFDISSGVPPLVAHKFLREINTSKLSVESLLSHGLDGGLFDENNPIRLWGEKLSKWITLNQTTGIETLLQIVGRELLIDTVNDHEILMRRIEIVRTFLNLATTRVGVNPKENLVDFLSYINRLEIYGHTIPVATLLGGYGVSVMTLHGSKGLEYGHVWVAHMNENVLMSQKRTGFTLPETLEALIETKDRAVATREVYVAITRAKSECTISFAKMGQNDTPYELAQLIADIPEVHFIKKSAQETEAEIVLEGPRAYVAQTTVQKITDIGELIEIVKDEYLEKKVSVTLLNNFFECPWKWYFRNLLQLPEAKTESLVFGSAVHGAIEVILKDTVKPTEKEIKEFLNVSLEKEGIKEEVTISRLTKDGVKTVLSWAKHYLPNISPDHTAERSLSYRDPSFPHLNMYGKIDLTERTGDGKVVVTDFKTGSSKTTGVIEKLDEEGRLSVHLRQLAMYSYLLQGAEKPARSHEVSGAGGDTRVTTSRLLFLEEDHGEKNALYSTHIDEEQIDMLKKDIADYDELVKSGGWVDRPCNFKSYGKQTECEYCKRAKNIYVQGKALHI